jgi:transposase
MRVLVDAMLKDLSPRLALLYSDTGRPSMAPETLLWASRLPVLYTSRREQWLLDQLAYNLLCRWVVERNMDAPVWDSSPLSKTRERLREGDIATTFFAPVVAQARERELLSDAHCTVEGTLIEAWAGQKRFQRKPAAPRQSPRMILATLALTSMESSAPMPPTSRRPIPRPACTKRPRGRKPSWPLWAICSWSIGTA